MYMYYLIKVWDQDDKKYRNQNQSQNIQDR